MTGVKRRTLQAVLAAIVGMGALTVGDLLPIPSGHFVTTADARIGRPLTPFSYAGVARRTTRRAVYGAYGAYGAPPVYGGAVVGRRCVQVATVYGGLITRCY